VLIWLGPPYLPEQKGSGPLVLSLYLSRWQTNSFGFMFSRRYDFLFYILNIVLFDEQNNFVHYTEQRSSNKWKNHAS